MGILLVLRWVVGDNGLVVYRGAKGVMPDRGQSSKVLMTNGSLQCPLSPFVFVADLGNGTISKITFPLTGLVTGIWRLQHPYLRGCTGPTFPPPPFKPL